MKNISTYSLLTKEQKKEIGLLSIGTFLEYLDLMLYIHMAVLLNELFFPKADPHATALLSAFAFCTTFVFRPIGALIFGYIGDNIGRKSTVIMTITLMSLSSYAMANIPTYEQVGITASWLLTICRIVQGMSSMGEIMGAEIYLTESTKPPIQYPVVALMSTFSSFGTLVALIIASLVTSYNFNWRHVFICGAGVALIGVVARTSLREAPDFADAKRQLKETLDNVENKISIDRSKVESNSLLNEKVSRVTSIAYFFINCTWPVSFYFTYMHCSNILKNSFKYSVKQIIHHNLLVSIVHLLVYITLTFLCYRIYPLKIAKFRLRVFWVLALMLPFLLNSVTSPLHVLLIQCAFMIFNPQALPAISIYINHFPIFKRFSYTSWIFALSRALMYVVTSFSLVYLVEYFGHFGVLMIMFPTSLAFAFGLNHFEKLEKVAGNYPDRLLNKDRVEVGA